MKLESIVDFFTAKDIRETNEYYKPVVEKMSEKPKNDNIGFKIGAYCMCNSHISHIFSRTVGTALLGLAVTPSYSLLSTAFQGILGSILVKNHIQAYKRNSSEEFRDILKEQYMNAFIKQGGNRKDYPYQPNVVFDPQGNILVDVEEAH